MNAKAMSNRHPVDQLGDIREQIKALGDVEKALKEQVSALMGEADSLGGAEWIASQSISERKGGVDEKKATAAGVNLDAFRKPPTPVVTIKTTRRAEG